MAILALPVDQRIIDIDSRRFASIEKAVVELITNCDDSYTRLERAGVPVSGAILIGYERHDNGAVIFVSDQSEGMTLERMCQVLPYGGAHSQMAQGISAGRGYFGRGLKQAIFGLGHGWVESVHDGRYGRVDLYRNADFSYVYDDQGGDRPADDADFARLNLQPSGAGTRVTIIVDNPEVSLPYFRSLVTALSNNIYLRDIFGRRTLRLLNGNQKGSDPTVLHFEEPASELLLGPDAPGTFIYQGVQYDFSLTLKKATASELILKGDERTNGLLVISGTAVLDCQFFRFENQLGTEYLFGKVACSGLVDMLAAGHVVISDDREGLNLKDPFVSAFAEAVSDAIAPMVENERLRLSHVDHASTSKRTEGLIQQLLRRMNQVAVEDLGIILPPGPGSGRPGPFDTGRPAVLRFSTPFYYRPTDHSFTVTMLVDRNRLLNEQRIECTYALPDTISVSPEVPEIVVGDLPENNQFYWKVMGNTLGASGRISVSCGQFSADCDIVIGQHGSHHANHFVGGHGHPRPLPIWDNSTDLFAGYELRNLENDIDRGVYSTTERLILINTEAPTVRLYIDGQGHFRDAARLLLAELFLDAIASEFARRYIDRTTDKGDIASYEEAKHVFVRRYGLEVHRIMMGG